jgi:hypothetical protein
MNNPLAQQAQYYLNESSRLSEELNTEIEYSAVLEAVLEELVGTEDFLKIMEVYSNPGSIDLTASGGERSNKPGRNNKANVKKRIGQLGQIAIARQSKPKPVVGVDGIRGRGDAEDQLDRDRQDAKDAAIAFKTHGGQVDFHGNLLPSASNDNTSGIRMKDAKQEGVPILVNPRDNKDPQQDVGEVNKNRLERKSKATRFALQRPMPGNDEGEETKGQYAKRMNAAAAKKARIAAGKDAATRSGMVTMQDHYDLVQGIMNLLTSNEKTNDSSVNELSDLTHKNYRKKATIDLAERGLKARIHGMQVGNAAATVGFGNPNAASEEDVEDLSKEGDENSRKIMKRLHGLTASERLKPLGGQPLDMPGTSNGPIAIRARTGAQRRLLGTDRPINSSYEPNLVQGIMNLLANSRNEKVMDEGIISSIAGAAGNAIGTVKDKIGVAKGKVVNSVYDAKNSFKKEYSAAAKPKFRETAARKERVAKQGFHTLRGDDLERY